MESFRTQLGWCVEGPCNGSSADAFAVIELKSKMRQLTVLFLEFIFITEVNDVSLSEQLRDVLE